VAWGGAAESWWRPVHSRGLLDGHPQRFSLGGCLVGLAGPYVEAYECFIALRRKVVKPITAVTIKLKNDIQFMFLSIKLADPV
jgi:hypothetical protein